MAAEENNGARKRELARIAANCRWVPARAPRDFWEALQMYWFMHLDRYFYPFYRDDIDSGTLSREQARELLECFWIKLNNHPAPPKVGVTAEESGTYNDFTNINIGGLLPDGSDGVNELSYLMLEVMGEIHLLQPQGNIQLSRRSEDRFLRAAMKVVAKGYGYPSLFNADGIVEQMLRCGKSLEDAREGGDERLRRDGGLRQGGLHPDRLPEPPQDPGDRAARRRRSRHGAADRSVHRRRVNLP
jgi:formate C-acetyltransferase